jgi:hypothetical protein
MYRRVLIFYPARGVDPWGTNFILLACFALRTLFANPLPPLLTFFHDTKNKE